MKKFALYLFMGLISLGGCIKGDEMGQESLALLPFPQEVTMRKGQFNPSQDLMIKYAGLSKSSDPVLFEQLNEAIFKAGGSLAGDNIREGNFTQPEQSGSPLIWIGIPGSDPDFYEQVKKVFKRPDDRIGEQGYLLSIREDEILIAANTNQGVFYGVQTLRQLVRQYKGTAGIPSLKISDWPAIPNRAIMDDISRGQVPGNAYIKNQIRRYSEMKINQISFYIEHVVKTKKHPGFSPDDGALTIDEIKELSEYAKGYHIEMIGSFQSLGHFEKILSVPEFRYLGATDRMLDPLNPQAIDFLRDVYREMAPAFSSEWFTPNCDEAWDLSRAELTGEAADLGVARIYADHIKRIDTTLRELNKRTLIWGDIIMEFPEILELIPEHILLGAWNYDASESFAEFIDPLRNAGFDFTVSPGVLNSNRLFPDFNMAYTNIQNFINEGFEKGTVGVYTTIWDDGGPHFFNHDWYGVAYAAGQSWRPNRDDREVFDKRFSLSFYDDKQNSVPLGIRALNELAELGPSYEMNEWIFNKYLIPEPGTILSYNLEEWEEIRNIAAGALELFETGNPKRYQEDMASLRFVCQQYLFLAESRIALFESAENYQKALESEKEDPGNTNREKSLAHLQTARNLVLEQSRSFENLFSAFEYLWSLESRSYWWEESIVVYQRRMNAFSDQLSLLDKAIASYNSGKPLPPVENVRLGISTHSGQPFQFWLTCGPLPVSETEGFSENFLLSMGGEEKARPYPGMEITYHETKKIRWHKYDSPYRHMVDLNDACPSQEKSVTYAYCSLDSPSDKITPAVLVFEEGATLFCNGEKIFEVFPLSEPFEKELNLPLVKGRNHILLKFDRTDPERKFTFMLPEEDVRNHKQKYSIK